MSQGKNQAAFLTGKKVKPLKVEDADSYTPGPDEVLVKNAALAINPVDWKIQEEGIFIEKFPAILGCDVAGEIVSVGDNIKDLKAGDRVLGHCAGLMTNIPSQNGFQAYTILHRQLVSTIPSSLAFTSAAVLPLAISTASAGLYQKDYLALDLPHADPPRHNGQTVLIWGGASSVGSCAIQLARCSGYEVFTTASKKNFKYCEGLGATKVFDSYSEDVVKEIVAALEGKQFAGIYDAISLKPTVTAAVEIAGKVDGAKMIATVLPDSAQASTDKVTVKPVFAPSIMHNEVGPAIYIDFLPAALEAGSLVAKPDPMLVGYGLESVQKGMDTLKEGVSAAKVVVTLI